MTARIPSLIGIILAMFIGAIGMLTAPFLWEHVLEQYDLSNPVWIAKRVTVVDRDVGAVTLHVIGEKRRACSLHRTWAQVYYDGQTSTDAVAQRKGGAVLGIVTRPVGTHDIGDIVVAPVPPEAVELVIRVEHECDGRDVASELARVRLQ